MIQIRIRNQRIFTDDVKGFELSVMGRRYHLGYFQSGLIRQCVNAPGFGHFLVGRRVYHLLVATVNIRQTSHVTGPLDVVLPPQGVDPAAFNAEIAAQHGQVGQGFDIVRPGGVLGDSHAVQDTAALGAGIQAGGINDLLGGDSGNFRHIIRCIFFNGFFDFIKSLGAPFDILFGVKVFLDDDVHQAVYPGDIGAQVLP